MLLAFGFGVAAIVVPVKWVTVPSLLACVACVVVFAIDRRKKR